MLQLLERKAGSGLLLMLLRMPMWEPDPRMFKKGQREVSSMKEAEVPLSATDKLSNTMRNDQLGASPIWWRDSWQGVADKPLIGEILMLV